MKWSRSCVTPLSEYVNVEKLRGDSGSALACAPDRITFVAVSFSMLAYPMRCCSPLQSRIDEPRSPPAPQCPGSGPDLLRTRQAGGRRRRPAHQAAESLRASVARSRYLMSVASSSRRLRGDRSVHEVQFAES